MDGGPVGRPRAAGAADPDAALGEVPIDAAGAVLQLPDWQVGEPLPELEVATNSQAMRDLALGALAQVPLQRLELEACHADAPTVKCFPEVPVQFLETAAFLPVRAFRPCPACLAPGEHGERGDRQRIRVHATDPVLMGSRAPYPVVIHSAREDPASLIACSLEGAGFPVLVGGALVPIETTDQAIRLEPVHYRHEAFDEVFDLFRAAVTSACAVAGIAINRYPGQSFRRLGEGSYAALSWSRRPLASSGKPDTQWQTTPTGSGWPWRPTILFTRLSPASPPDWSRPASALWRSGRRHRPWRSQPPEGFPWC